MSLKEQQNLLAKLYTDAEFRRAFLSEPEKIGVESGLSADEIREIAEIMPEELHFFADSLVWKRLGEAEKFLPLTRRVLGEDFTGNFREFSQTYNPRTVKKHFEDALAFCRFLQTRKIPGPAKCAAKFEAAKLEFFGFEKRIAVCRLDYDVRSFSGAHANPAAENHEKTKKIAVWLRTGKRIRHFFI
ncbi:MAG TPA: hypothetical protein VIL74_09980 [Pyrinomonadaceae bacterium]|jgi:hypothetical protein